MARVLVVDDDQSVVEMLALLIEERGHRVSSALNLREALRVASSGDFDLVFLDVNLPDGDGLEALPEFKRLPSKPEVIIMTGAGTPDGAELAIKCGVWDYIQKPFPLREMMLPFLRALQYREEKSRAAGTAPKALKLTGIVGSHPSMQACYDLMAKAAATDTNVLITGETGTGKELFASAVHQNSGRARRPFVVVDCSALPETLVESMLFGHEKGAFTGADAPRQGLVRQADGGTLFLDEVGELAPRTQKSFLRVLQERRFRPVGGSTEIGSDFRLIAATNRDLASMVAKGEFREDLLFRLKAVVIELPPLRERTPDIVDLALHHVTRVCERHGRGVRGLSPDFLEALTAYPWPGNVRELFHAVERAVAAAADQPTLFPKHLPDEIRVHLARTAFSRSAPCAVEPAGNSKPATILKLKDYRHLMERRYLDDLLAMSRGNMAEAARLAGLSRSRLYEILAHHQLSVSADRS